MTNTSQYIKSFARRNCMRNLNERQKAILTNHLPKYTVNNDNIIRIFNQFSLIHFELGFGTGDRLFAMASLHPDALFIGCEPYLSGVGVLLDKVYSSDLQNVFLNTDDGRLMLALIPDGSLASISVLFPDPWPKKRHHKRRVLQQDFLELASQKLSTDGEVIIATDHMEYAEFIKHCIIEVKTLSIKFMEYHQPPHWIATRYEKKAEESDIFYCILQKT